MDGDILVAWTSPHGDQEHEECWPSVARFLAWAQGEELHGTFRAYEEDDGEFVLIEKGRF